MYAPPDTPIRVHNACWHHGMQHRPPGGERGSLSRGQLRAARGRTAEDKRTERAGCCPSMRIARQPAFRINACALWFLQQYGPWTCFCPESFAAAMFGLFAVYLLLKLFLGLVAFFKLLLFYE